MWLLLVILYSAVLSTANGEIEISGVKWSKNFEPTPLGLPIVTKCCNVGQSYSDFDCVNESSFEPIIYNFEMKTTNYTKLTAVIKETCEGGYTVHGDNNFTIFENGSAFIWGTNYEDILKNYPPRFEYLLQIGEYCLESTDGDLTVFICSENNDTKIEKADIYNAGLIVSIPFLLLTTIVYFLIKELNDHFGKMLVQYVIFLAITMIILCVVKHFEEKLDYCKIIAVAVHFPFIISLFLLNALFFYAWVNMRYYVQEEIKSNVKRKLFIFCSLWSYGLPTLFLGSFVIYDQYINDKYNDDKTCSLYPHSSTRYIFYTIISTSLLIDILILLTTYVQYLKLRPITKRIPNSQEEFVKNSKIIERIRNLNMHLKVYTILFLFAVPLWIADVINYETVSRCIRMFSIFHGFYGVCVFFAILIYPKVVRHKVIKGIREDMAKLSCCKKEEPTTQDRSLIESPNNIKLTEINKTEPTSPNKLYPFDELAYIDEENNK